MFDFTALPSVVSIEFENGLCCPLLIEKRISLLGSPGIGKTHLAILIGLKALTGGYKTYFITVHHLVTSLRRGDQEGKLKKASCLCKARHSDYY
jgi:DNA replication protein DnaC